MAEKKQLERCLVEVERKFNRGPRKEWTDYNFKKLQNCIYESSGISISTHTLKRFFGKIKYKTEYSPQEATKDALAKYLEFDSWDDLIKEYQIEPESEIVPFDPPAIIPAPKKKKVLRKLHIIPVVIFLALVVTGGILFTIYKINSRKFPEFTFNVRNAVGTVPNTVTFNFDVSNLRPVVPVIDFGFTHPYLSREYLIVDRDTGSLNHAYQIPGIYKASLKYRNITADSAIIVAKSKGWVGFIHKEETRDYHWLTNMVEKLSFNSNLTLSRSDVIKFGGDTTGVYLTSFRNIREFGIPGDNFKLDSRVMNSESTGGITCFDVNLYIHCEYTYHQIRLVEKGCHRWCRIKFGEILLDGSTHNLSALSTDLNDWNYIDIQVVNKNVVVKIDDNEVFRATYTHDSGNIFGIEYKFKGSGMVDFISLRSVEDEVNYFDDFTAKSMR
jgi:PKD repeat protein